MSIFLTEGDCGHLDDADANGADGGGVIAEGGLAAMASHTALATSIALNLAYAVRAATQCKDVSGIATLLGSARRGAGFETWLLWDAMGLADDLGEVTVR